MLEREQPEQPEQDQRGPFWFEVELDRIKDWRDFFLFVVMESMGAKQKFCCVRVTPRAFVSCGSSRKRIFLNPARSDQERDCD
jgi:hypothetical protein